MKRVLGDIRGRSAGPTLVVVAGIHGNEEAGVTAVRRVLRRFAASPIRLHGELVALAGNVAALTRGKRYLDRDLNRLWPDSPRRRQADRIVETARRLTNDPFRTSESRELAELRSELDAAIERARGQVFCLDLHSTSAHGGPFAVVRNTPTSATFAARFPVTVLFGLAERLQGVLTNYMDSRNCPSMAVEGGQHDAAATTRRLEAAIWVGLWAAGLLARRHPEVTSAYDLLDRARNGLPRRIEVLSRHGIEPSHGFRMAPGFNNIARVRAGQLLAQDRSGPIRALEDGYLMLPLYQKLGSDGFFLGRALRR